MIYSTKEQASLEMDKQGLFPTKVYEVILDGDPRSQWTPSFDVAYDLQRDLRVGHKDTIVTIRCHTV